MMDRRGTVLIEALVAITILVLVGLSTTTHLSQILLAVDQARDAEREMARAERVLIATSLLTAAELDERLGRREVEEFWVNVARPRPGLYRIAVAPLDASARELLATSVFPPSKGRR